jgi:diguanylate cyclase (GGDEF)-like protein/PAS domain S-box-containing protein
VAVLGQRLSLLQSIIDDMPAAITIKNPHGRTLLANRQAMSLSQQHMSQRDAHADQPDQPDIRQSAPPIAGGLSAIEQEVLVQKKLLSLKEVFMHTDGPHTFITMKFPLYDPQQGIYAIGSIAADITEYKRLEAALQESEEKFRSFFEQSQDGLILVNDQGTIIEWSQGAEHIFGLCHEVVIGRPQWDILFQITPEEMRNSSLYEHFKSKTFSLIQAIRADTPLSQVDQRFQHQFQHQFQRADGNLRMASAQIFPIRTDKEVFIGAIVRDITEHKEVEAALRESRSRLRALFDNAAIGVALFDVQGQFIEMNHRLTEMLGYTLKEIKRLNYLDIIHADNKEESHSNLLQLRAGTIANFRTEKRYICRDGTVCWGDTSVQALYNEQGHIEAVLGIIADITDRKRAEEEQQLWVARLEQLTRDISLINEMGDFLQSCQTASEAYEIFAFVARNLFHHHSGTLYMLDETGTVLNEVAHWGDLSLEITRFVPDDCWALRRGQPYMVSESHIGLRCPHLDPSATPPYLCVPLISQGESMGVLRIIAEPASLYLSRERWKRLAIMVADHLALALSNLQLRARLQDQAIRDALTGLFNRRYMDETLKRELQRAERHNHSLGVIMLDIDHFKWFNDTYGHKAGDVLLHSLGTFLQTSTRGEDIVCRYGGEEFTLILPEATLEDTWRRAEQLRLEVKHLSVEHNTHLLGAITVSLGVAVYPNHGDTFDAVLQEADTALYQAKMSGRDRVMVAAVPKPHGYDRYDR